MKILVFDIGGTAIKQGVCVDDKLLGVEEVPTNAELGGRHIMDTVIGMIEKERDYDAIGVSTTGNVQAEEGYILYANNNIPEYTDMPVRRELERRFHVPVAVENDVNAMAVGEAVYGGGREYDSFLCLTYGTGVGGAIVENRQIYRGSNFSAAEFGAIVTHGTEKIKGGDFLDGCYERYASTSALVNKARAYDASLCDGRAIFGRLGDPAVMGLLDEWADEVMLGLSTLIHIFNPAYVILGGGIMSQPLVLEKIRERKEKYIIPCFFPVEIKAAALGNSAGLFGVNYLAGKRLSEAEQPKGASGGCGCISGEASQNERRMREGGLR